MTLIHPTAIIDPQAVLAEGVEVGPNAIIEAGVTIGARTKIGPLCHIQGHTTIGEDNVIGTGATIGLPPQVVGVHEVASRCVIGDRNVIREYVSIHRAMKDDGTTTIGSDCFLMGFSHVAHDCHLGDRVIIANGALLAGHVTVGDRAFISGNVVVHQFCRIGRLAMIAGVSGVLKDIPPFMTAQDAPARLRKLNLVGMRRAGIPAESIRELRRIYRDLYLGGKLVSEVLAHIDPTTLMPEGREFLKFYKESKRGVSPSAQLGKPGTTGEEDDDE